MENLFQTNMFMQLLIVLFINWNRINTYNIYQYITLNLFFCYNVYFQRHEITKHGVRLQDTSPQDMRNSLGYFKCQDINCGLVYKTKATLKRYYR